MTLKWTRAASEDLESVERYISRDNPEAAIDAVLEIIRHVEMLAEHPGIGRPGRVEGTRELVISGLPYVIPYTERGDAIVISESFMARLSGPRAFEGPELRYPRVTMPSASAWSAAH